MADFINNFDDIYSNFINSKIKNYNTKLHVTKYLNESEIEIIKNIKQKKYGEHIPKIYKEIRLNTLLTNIEDHLKELNDLKKEQNEISKNKIIEYKENIKTLIKQTTNILDEYKKNSQPIENINTIRENFKEIDEKIKNNKENKKYSEHLPKVFKELNLDHLLNILEDNLKGLNDFKKKPPEFLENHFIAYRKNINTLIKQSIEILDEHKKMANQQKI